MSLVGKRIRALCVAAVFAVGCVAGAAPASGDVWAGCEGWQVGTVVQGLEKLENLEPDGHDGFYLAGIDSTLYHVDASGQVHTVLTHQGNGFGGLQLDGSTLYFADFTDGGTFSKLDTTTGRSVVLAASGGNGLLRLPGGDLLTTWVGTEGGHSKGLTRYWHDTGVVQPNWAPVPRAEGLALSPDHRTVYTDDLFTGQIYRVPLEAPDRWTVAGRLPGLAPGPDDLTMTASGDIFVAAHLEGTIYRFDSNTGASCVVASGLSGGWTGPSSVRVGPDGKGWALYVTGFDGTLRRLRPPVGVDLAPAPKP
ncbi:SMP-30/gluconolactonase/LRE family protein [Nocardia sp. NPDC004278]